MINYKINLENTASQNQSNKEWQGSFIGVFEFLTTTTKHSRFVRVFNRFFFVLLYINFSLNFIILTGTELRQKILAFRT